VLFGLLRKSITSRVTTWGGKDRSIATVGPNPTGITEGVADYADVIQFGTRKKTKRNHPARPYIGLSESNEKAIEGAMIRRFRSAFGW
jgi:phage gpG-like protein